MIWRLPPSRAILTVLFMALIHAFSACSSEEESSTGTGQDPLTLSLAQVYSTVTSLAVEVAYEPNAEPYTGTIHDEVPTWWILQNNIEALLQDRGISLHVPWDLEGMDPISGQDEEAWTSSEIVELARGIWDTPLTESAVSIRILFLNGNYEDEGTVNPQILGVSFVGTSLIAIFKDVIVNSSSSTAIAWFVEQATLVHETGHVLGLVDNGLPMVSDHADYDHVRHCTNQDCVMYWKNEGASDMRDFVRQVMETDSLVLFGDECLEDAWAYVP